MNGKYALDTTAVIALFAGEAGLIGRLREAEEIFLPSVVLGELYYGAYRSKRQQENMSRIDQFATESAVLDCGVETARRYGEIKNALRAKGKPIPENDIWVAAITVEHGLTLLAHDAHFHEMAELSLETWSRAP